ncbi:amino acid/amide ABC transporter membrane protein 1, HAAT family [Oceanospirillum multiglobuliferum]|uniref:Branched-chain amino acid ABC transporter permease n=1 Tax=Oceanospirillum multiglobuliferum TaxID=64969 RepID=A0A1T4RXB1_9GAMM|nr:branched-chain amino acid ABC transporter permease [Oceanospirillum multiglobuliferum]OPX54584.1 branched-chain amino acid ABC transporter permease [Oceanospirillum multiglobuliferum]SKA20496.1 amino acid/amide ABC transporter membrane protein 1, HAAT family [Oceanospirillum multiglobuliferum]
MSVEFLQYLFSGVTIGATYALVGLGFAIIYNASHVINFAQGEFIMIGSMATVSFLAMGMPMPVAILLAVALAVVTGMLLQKFAVAPAKNADVVTIIIITIGASILLRGLAQVFWGKSFHALPAFSGNEPINIAGATIVPQNLWVLGVTLVIVAAVSWFFTKTIIGKAILATSHNADAAKLVGINTNMILLFAFGLSALLGAVAGIIVAPITTTSYEVGIMLGLKGFVAAVLGGLGSGVGAIVGGLILGIAEAMAAGYISSDYKDAVPFVIILFILFFMPSGLFGSRGTERV